MKQEETLKETMEVIHEISKLVKQSPQRDTHLKCIRKESGNKEMSIHAFCPTRWSVRADSCAAILENNDVLMDLWKWSLSVLTDSEMKARIRFVTAYMKRFNFYFGCCLGKLLLTQVDNLSTTLQDPNLSAAEGQSLAQLVVETLEEDRASALFNLWWDAILLKKDNDIDIVKNIQAALTSKPRILFGCKGLSSQYNKLNVHQHLL